MFTLILTVMILINFIESKYLLVETDNNKDDGADYRSDPDADLGCKHGKLPKSYAKKHMEFSISYVFEMIFRQY